MELIIIDESRLKIMLTETDMRHYDLYSERITVAGASTRRAFRHIFEDARAQVGFDTAGERLFVQLYTSHGGGCEIFVTKLGLSDSAHEDEGIDELYAMDGADAEYREADDLGEADRPSDGERALLRRLGKKDDFGHRAAAEAYEPPETAAYRLPDGEVLFALCRRLLAWGYRGESSVYIDEHERWYLLLSPAEGTVPPFLAEYASPLPDAESLVLWLSEHGRAICTESAVEILGRV